jgi:hypothetical protein
MSKDSTDKSKKTNAKYGAALNQLSLNVYNWFWLIIIAVCLAVVATGYELFLLPKYNSVVSNEEITSKQQEYIDKLQYYNQLIDLKNTYNKISPEDRDKINQIVSTVNDQNELYREVEYIVKKNGLTVDGIAPVTLDSSYSLPDIYPASKRSPLLNTMKLTMTSCTMSHVNYEALIRVLKTFELNLRIMDVVKVEYDPAKGTAAAQFITYQF